MDGSGGDGSGDDGRSGDSDGGGRVRTVGSSRTAAIVCKVKVKEAKAERRRVSGEAGALDLVSISYIFVFVNSECGVHLWSLARGTDHGFDVILPAGCLGHACMQDQVSLELTMERPMRDGSDSQAEGRRRRGRWRAHEHDTSNDRRRGRFKQDAGVATRRTFLHSMLLRTLSGCCRETHVLSRCLRRSWGAKRTVSAITQTPD